MTLLVALLLAWTSPEMTVGRVLAGVGGVLSDFDVLAGREKLRVYEEGNLPDQAERQRLQQRGAIECGDGTGVWRLEGDDLKSLIESYAGQMPLLDPADFGIQAMIEHVSELQFAAHFPLVNNVSISVNARAEPIPIRECRDDLAVFRQTATSIVTASEPAVIAVLDNGRMLEGVASEANVEALIRAHDHTIVEPKCVQEGECESVSFHGERVLLTLLQVVPPSSTLVPVRLANPDAEYTTCELIRGLKMAADTTATVINYSHNPFSLLGEHDALQIIQVLTAVLERSWMRGRLMVMSTPQLMCDLDFHERYPFPRVQSDRLVVVTWNSSELSRMGAYGDTSVDISTLSLACVPEPGSLNINQGKQSSFAAPKVSAALAWLLSMGADAPQARGWLLGCCRHPIFSSHETVSGGVLDLEAALKSACTEALARARENGTKQPCTLPSPSQASECDCQPPDKPTPRSPVRCPPTAHGQTSDHPPNPQ